jgi:hypothetical protein
VPLPRKLFVDLVLRVTNARFSRGRQQRGRVEYDALGQRARRMDPDDAPVHIDSDATVERRRKKIVGQEEQRDKQAAGEGEIPDDGHAKGSASRVARWSQREIMAIVPKRCHVAR